MKLLKYCIALFFCLCFRPSYGQLTYEHSYSQIIDFRVVSLEDETQKFMVIDSATRNVLLFNDDHSLWKRIPTTVPAGKAYAGITCVSTKMFNLDADVEVALAYYTFGTPSVYQTEIWTEKGTILQTLADVAYLTPVLINGKSKVVGANPNTQQNIVYSVPGRVLAIAKGSEGPISPETRLYPNPFESAATLKYKLPSGIREAKLVIFDLNGAELRSYAVTDHFSDMTITRGALPSGIYMYKLITPSGASAAERFEVK